MRKQIYKIYEISQARQCEQENNKRYTDMNNQTY